MIEEPVAKASSSSTQPNSRVVQSTTSSPSRDRCTPTSAATNSSSATKSRSKTASIEFAAARSKPSSRAVASGSSGTLEPASAPAPSGETAARRSQSFSRSTSRATACTCASSWWANSTGCACCRWVIPGAAVSRWRSAWPSSASSSSASLSAIRRTWSRRKSRRSVATWSLRLRPARSLPPRVPSRSRRPRSRAVCTSSSSIVGRNDPFAAAASRSSSADSIRASSSWSSRPAWCSTRACARDASRSYGASRQSNCTLTESRASASAGLAANRPPHSRIGADPAPAGVSVSSGTGAPGVWVGSGTGAPGVWVGAGTGAPGVWVGSGTGAPGEPPVAVRRPLAGQAPQLDEPLGQRLVERVLGVVRRQPVVVERGHAATAGDHCAAAVQRQPHVAGDVLAGGVDEGVQRPTQRGEPQPVVRQLTPALLHAPLEPGQVALNGDVLQLLVRGDQGDRAGALVDLPALDADQPVLDHVEASRPLRPRPGVQLGDDLQHRELAAVERDRYAVDEGDHHLVRLPRDGRVRGVGVDVFDGAVPDVLQEARLHRATPDVLVDGVRRGLGHVDRQRLLGRERDRLVPGHA